ncbi:hypothetical protein SAMN05216412_10381 [Nitrosospira multiformis]|uniref:Uncharacterized protein n=1 Tax=Nitrosospira multiformis TaxID=1231 RepID=A0A1I0BNN5_9PROT|nr:MgtC/SapB family protein [Nitrosospira multiformis]SET08302.1 hypothetical protein SAMN05216412_10381 [Nitrosospira multiformis]
MVSSLGASAGFRTHALVCLASSLLILVTLYQWKGLPPNIAKVMPEDQVCALAIDHGFGTAIMRYRITEATCSSTAWMSGR